jgi:hypothetical protein
MKFTLKERQAEVQMAENLCASAQKQRADPKRDLLSLYFVLHSYSPRSRSLACLLLSTIKGILSCSVNHTKKSSQRVYVPRFYVDLYSFRV